MPLPPALAKRLALRGVIQPKQPPPKLKQSSDGGGGVVEEIIAENYDDDDDDGNDTYESGGGRLDSDNSKKPEISKFHRIGHSGCPNKSNPYHSCSQYCVSFWGRGKREPEVGYNNKRLKMLKKYPLPIGWVEVYDVGIARHYYWNINSDEVCWLSPAHPKAKPSRPVSEIREEILRQQIISKNQPAIRTSDSMPPPPPPPVSSSSGSSSSKRAVERERERERLADTREEKKRRLKEGKDDLDPMDPAAYSDIPRGTWKSGLADGDDAKTGVDSTASGPLFQMRPYPSPGDILRANAEKKKSS